MENCNGQFWVGRRAQKVTRKPTDFGSKESDCQRCPLSTIVIYRIVYFDVSPTVELLNVVI